MTTPIQLSRRQLLQHGALGGAAFLLADFFPALAKAANSSSPDHPFFIFCSFEGGWDQLLACDPRDATDPAHGEGKTINPGYDVVAPSDPLVSSVLAETGGSGVYTPTGAAISVGPTMYNLAKAHFEDLCIVRGIDMGTLTHAVGTRYFLTGKFPRGLQANGSSASAAVAGLGGAQTDIPNLVVGMESYNEDFDSFATGVAISSPTDVLAMVSPLSEQLEGDTAGAVQGYIRGWGCTDIKLDGQGAVAAYLDSADRSGVLLSGELAEYFDFLNPSAATQSVLKHFGITGSSASVQSQMQGPTGGCFLAAQAISKGVSQAVSICLATGIDHHDDAYEDDHAPMLSAGFDALSQLITYLKETLDANGKPFWDRCVLLATSEFARTPSINSRGGRDHHLSSSCLVAGKGIKGNQIIGGTDETLTRQLIDPATGKVGGDMLIRPPDVHATILAALGLDAEHLANQDPRVITAMLS